MSVMKKIGLIVMAMFISVTAQAATKVLMQTNYGDIKLELSEEKAPITVQNFLNYTKSGFYNGLVFHRVIPGFMVQGGGMNENLVPKENNPPIINEATNGLKNDRGTIAMARTSDVNSATSQFFINVVDNEFLNYKNSTPQGFGYAVFGKVIDGMDVVDKIAAVKTTTKGPYADVPVEPVIINSVTIIEE